MRGDSFTQGNMVPFRELSSEVLKARLNDAGPGTYEGINAGTSGYSTDQELVFFHSEGKRLYFVKDGHWNPLRHKLAEKILAKHVLSNIRGKSEGRTPMVRRRRDRVAASEVGTGQVVGSENSGLRRAEVGCLKKIPGSRLVES